jgi:hypothetical protein
LPTNTPVRDAITLRLRHAKLQWAVARVEYVVMNASPKRGSDSWADHDFSADYTDWADVEAVYASKDDHIERFAQIIMDALPSDTEGIVPIEIGLDFELVVGETGYEVRKSIIELQFELLKQLESEGGLHNPDSDVRWETHPHKNDPDGWPTNILYATFKADPVTLLPILRRYVQDIGAHRREAQEKTRARETKRYGIEYDKKGRHIYFADGRTKEKFLIGRPQVNSNGCRVFEYVYAHPGREITIDELKRYGRYSPGHTTQLKHIVFQLGFNGEIRRIFFPMITKQRLTFRNTIYENDLSEEKISIDKLELQLNEIRRGKE